VLPLFSATSLRSLSETILSASDPAAPGSRARLDGGRWRARLARLARPFARPLRPALGWGAAGAAGGVLLVAGLAPAPVAWARHLAPVALPLLLSGTARPDLAPEPRPRGVLGDAPRPDDATRSGDAQGPRAPAAERNDGPGQRKPAASRRDPAPPDQGQNRLGEELTLLEAARQALLRGERAAALERIEAHAQRFPRGRLALLRERLRSSAEALPVTTTGGTTRQERP
jgi:hypothetical protein